MVEQKEKILVTGAGGFIGHHMVRFLKSKGYWVRGVDIKYPEFSSKDEAYEFLLLDLRNLDNCKKATEGIDKAYNLTANVGGIGFVSEFKAEVMRDNALININVLEAARQNEVKRVFFSSAAGIYPAIGQETTEAIAFKEEDAYPANPGSEYGWEKLFSERLYQSYQKQFGLGVRIARFHNIFGPEGVYEGPRVKPIEYFCRKIALANDGDEVEIYGDGTQTRSFLYVDDCLEASYRLMESDFSSPLNIGSERAVSINELVDIISDIAGKKLKKVYIDKPQGPKGRTSDNSLAREKLNWKPQVSLEEGLKRTYQWIKEINNKKI